MEWEKPVLVDLNMATFEAACNTGKAIDLFNPGMGPCGPVGSGAVEECNAGSGVGA